MPEQPVMDSVDRKAVSLVYREMDRVYPRLLPDDGEEEADDE